MDGTEKSLFKIVGTTMKHFASYVYLKTLQAGESIRLRVYNKVDDVSYWKLDGDVTDSVGGNNGTVTNISSLISQWKFDGDVLDSVGSNNGTITYNTNLKTLWKFESNLNDSTSGAHALTLVAGTTTYITGQEGKALSFDGSTYYSANSAVDITGTNDRSVSFWVKTPSTFTAFDMLFSYGAGTNNNMFGAFWIDSGSTSLLTAWGFYNDINSVTVFQPNTWYHIVMTVGSTGTVRKMYVNGILDNSTTTTALNTTSSTFYLGTRADSVGTDVLHGSLDEFRIYNIVLSQAQVSALYMNGKFAQSHTFDGGEQISKTSPVGIPTGTSDRTVSFWVNTQSNSGFIFDWGVNAINNAFGAYWTSNGSNATLNLAGFNNDVTCNTIFQLGIWYHIVIILSSSGTIRTCYVNGILDKTATTTALNTSSSSLFIGSDDTGNAYITGQVDEFRIYNAALSASQVLGLYNYTGSNYVTPLPVGNALSLDGSSYVTVPNTTPYNFERTNAWSASIWVKTTSTGIRRLIAHYNGTLGYILSLVNGSSNDAFQIEMYGTAQSLIAKADNIVIRDGNWHNLIFTYSGNSNISGVTMYLDGVSKSVTSITNTLATSIQNTSSIYLGTRNAGTENYIGLLDEIQIFNYVISSAEINAINAGRFTNTHPIGLWHFDGDLYDYSGQGSTGSPTGTMTYVTGALSGSYGVPNTHFNFDGSEYVNVGNPSNLQFEYIQPFSIAFWLRTPVAGSSLTPIIGNGINFDQKGIEVYEQFGVIIVRLINTSSSNEISVNNSTGTSCNDNLFHHYVITYDGTSKAAGVKIYQDGTLLSNTVNTDNLTKSILSGSNWNIGSFSGGVSPTTAELDDFRIYNRALSSAEVSDLYTYPDSAMKSLVYDKTYSGPLTDVKFVVFLPGNQNMVTAQQTGGTNRIVSWERTEVS